MLQSIVSFTVNKKFKTKDVKVETDTIVVHANGLGNGIVRYVQIVMPGFGLQHTAEMRRRDTECSYEWYSTTPYNFAYDVSSNSQC